jgi:hypothetical protein
MAPAGGEGLGGLAPFVPLALGLLAQLDEGAGVKDGLRAWAKADPLDALLTTVVGGGLAFYLAEHPHNPGCATPWDGILYMSTALSVGYDNLFPTTPAGHALAAFVQAIGPALSGMAFDEPAARQAAAAATEAEEARARAEVDRAILARLDEIVHLLRRADDRPDDGGHR